MQFATVILFLTASILSPLIMAMPSPLGPFRRSPALHKRGLPGAVYTCTDPNFTGFCGWRMPTNICLITGTGNQQIESIGPDPGGFCVLYGGADCQTNTEITRLSFPGLASKVPTFLSMMCFANGQSPRNANKTSNISTQKGVAALLAGGQGSSRNKELEEVLEKMERNGHAGGMIGLEKNVYY